MRRQDCSSCALETSYNAKNVTTKLLKYNVSTIHLESCPTKIFLTLDPFLIIEEGLKSFQNTLNFCCSPVDGSSRRTTLGEPSIAIA